MKFISAIFILLVLLTEGMRCSELRHAKHKNHNLNMRQLLKTVDSMPELPESFQFPVDVDLTKFMAMLERRFTKNENGIESVRTALRSLTSKGISFCQTGMTGCTSCGGKDPGQGTYVTTREYHVTFPKKFPGTPTVTSALNEISQKAPGSEDGYGWRIKANSVTSSGFTLQIELIDRPIYTFYANWIACYTL